MAYVISATSRLGASLYRFRRQSRPVTGDLHHIAHNDYAGAAELLLRDGGREGAQGAQRLTLVGEACVLNDRDWRVCGQSV